MTLAAATISIVVAASPEKVVAVVVEVVAEAADTEGGAEVIGVIAIAH